MAVNVNVKKLKENATIPTYGTEYAAGADLYACIEEAVTIEAGETKFIGTGIAMEIPEGTCTYWQTGFPFPGNCTGTTG